MSNKKLEETFNLPPIEDIEIEFEDEDSFDNELSLVEVKQQLQEYESQMSVAERADAAMPIVTGFEQLEREMDEYAAEAMSSFKDLIDLGHNVEDRNAAPIFDSASKMLSAALQAKQAKMDKKLKMLDLQQKQAKLELEQAKFKYQQEKDAAKNEDRAETIEGRIVGDRATMLAEIMAQMNKK